MDVIAMYCMKDWWELRLRNKTIFSSGTRLEARARKKTENLNILMYSDMLYNMLHSYYIGVHKLNSSSTGKEDYVL